jgi:uncharacterized membrane protein
MAHHSHHAHRPAPVPVRVRRLLVLAVAPFVLATVLGLIVLWPSGNRPPGAPAVPSSGEREAAVVTIVEREECGQVASGPGFVCSEVRARLETGPDRGASVTFDFAGGRSARMIQEGDRIIVARSSSGTGQRGYFFIDYQRARPLAALAALFAVVVVALSRWRGVAALAGLAVSVVVLVRFVLPAILEGRSPIAVAIVGSSAIMLLALYLAHGPNARTTSAVLGTLASLGVTGLLAGLFVELGKFSGVASEEATFLQVSADRVNLTGLLLGGIIIGALGVLDDVTITQASAVWELRLANPNYGFGELFRAALSIGRDHIASTVNTLVLAYVGASLPLMVLFSISPRPLGSILTSEVVAVEVVRTLVGSIGLVASVPITTGLAALVATREVDLPAGDLSARGRSDFWGRPAAEQVWRDDLDDLMPPRSSGHQPSETGNG